MKQHAAIVCRLYPDSAQKQQFSKTFGCCRKVWNLMLEKRQSHYKQTNETIYPTPAQFKKEYPYLKEVDSLALSNVQLDLEGAFKAFFAKRSGFPKFKSRRRSRKSYTTNVVNRNIRIEADSIRLPKVGTVKARIHRKAPDEWKLKSVTVRENPDGTYEASLLYEYENDVTPVRTPASHIGLDYKSDGLYVDSDGRRCEMPRWFRKSEKKLAAAQRKLAKKVGGRKGEKPSKNYEKQRKKTAKIARHIANQRKDFLHKESAAITKRYDLISVEDLNMKAMSRGLRLGKSVHDNGWRMFVEMLDYKQSRLGHGLQKVDRFFPSSQLCSVCGHKEQAVRNLSIRHWECAVCGANHDRDHNAARNVDQEGLRLWTADR